ncbi:MAG: sigma 54-interacting transcriptional regulator [Myxococcota bacterium]
MKNKATLVLVRPDPKRADSNHASDVRVAQEAANHPPCWVVLLGKGREKRRESMSQLLGLDGITKNGVNLFAPVEICADTWNSDSDASLPDGLAHYLAELGFRMPLRQSSVLEVLLAADFPPSLLAAVVEAVAVYPRVNLRLGDAELRSSLRWEHRRDKFRAPPPDDLTADLNGESVGILRVREQVARYADRPFPVLVLGETGTGKEVVATMLHEQSARTGRLMTQNAAQLPAPLAESLLFGHVKGAFTGADEDRPGRIREANGGTFFLDEVFNLEPAVQGKLLRALNRVEEGILLVERLGSTRPADEIHARLVVAALDDPRRHPAMNGGSSMREDLYYRVAAGLIRLPPLRECLDDLPVLCRRLLGNIAKDVAVESDGIAALREHRWPGNVRELRLVLLRAVMDGPPNASKLGADVLREALRTAALPSGATSLALPCDLAAEMKRIEVETMRAALRAAGSKHAAAGRMIGMGDHARNFKRKLEDAEARLHETETSDAE